MIDLHHPDQRRDVETVLTDIPGVRAARLVPGYDRAVDELHVVATVDRAPKQVVRDVQSALLAHFGIPTDHRVVSVVLLDDHDGSRSDRSVTIRRVAVDVEGLRARAEVTVDGPEGEVWKGCAEGPSSGPGRRRAIGRAALEALRPLLPTDRALEVEGVDVTSVLGEPVALCLLHVHGRSDSTTRCGSALVGEDEAAAVARAVLDATNRLSGAP